MVGGQDKRNLSSSACMSPHEPVGVLLRWALCRCSGIEDGKRENPSSGVCTGCQIHSHTETEIMQQPIDSLAHGPPAKGSVRVRHRGRSDQFSCPDKLF